MAEKSVPKPVATILNHTRNPYQFGLGAADGMPVTFTVPAGEKRTDRDGMLPGKVQASAEELATLKGNKTFTKLVEDEVLSLSQA